MVQVRRGDRVSVVPLTFHQLAKASQKCFLVIFSGLEASSKSRRVTGGILAGST